MASKQEVAKATPSPEPSTSGGELTIMQQMEQEAGAGFENADIQSYAIPFLLILQSGSPQCKKSDGAYIKGAEEGMFFNTVTQELFPGDPGVLLVPCYYRRTFIKWAPRDKGGGFMGEFLPSDPIVQTVQQTDKGSFLPDGNLLSDTRVHYCMMIPVDEKGIILPNDDPKPVVISMASTQVKKSRGWMSKMDGIKFRDAQQRSYTPPMYSHIYRASTVPEKNDQGTWFGWKLQLEARIEDARLFANCKEFKKRVSAGELKEAPPAQNSSGPEEVSF